MRPPEINDSIPALNDSKDSKLTESSHQLKQNITVEDDVQKDNFLIDDDKQTFQPGEEVDAWNRNNTYIDKNVKPNWVPTSSQSSVPFIQILEQEKKNLTF